uniref:IstB-like ATP binding protein n=1 Tax=Candidatus Kentrum sp. TUN TaxID=2126343 RepID=A0A451AI39_9GAMM|nr:MAG: IstB-like ATP binding protein [Candidatus Kentron sp. TUN]
MLIEREVLDRENRRLNRLLQIAKLRTPASVEEIDYRHPRGLERSKIATLASCDWIARHQNLLLTGLHRLWQNLDCLCFGKPDL